MNTTDTAKLLLDAKSRINLSKRKDWQALSEMRKYENELIRAGMTLCPDCLGKGEIRTITEMVDTPCDWCGRTGWDDTRKCTCWKCAGSGKIYNEKYGFEMCQTCSGNRVVPLHLDKSPEKS